eukprot:CAMPEP_0185724020 /NCGR_PEP_ID=MMETSP1171-20130828/640_1 /TAXON_ID=374046 /ORGANISM="Helicotheca tamensis, Strain CCMP826" /LENGTH=299 /DNA_ID=CAMNT_0028391791 /DNA_START=9 /DNA_END=908 /DNA_ORIENTATION=+
MNDSDAQPKRWADDALKLFAEAAASVSLKTPTSSSSKTTPAPATSFNTKTGDQAKPNEMTEVERKRRERRLMMNRITARERRKRKRELIDELQETVKKLTAKNVSLTESNRAMKRRLVELEGKELTEEDDSDTEEFADGDGSSDEAPSDVELPPTEEVTVADTLCLGGAKSDVPLSIPVPSAAAAATASAAAAQAAQAQLEYQTKIGLVRDMFSGVGSTSVNHSLPFLQLQQGALGGLAPFLSTPSSTLLSALTGASSACAPPELGMPQSVLGAAAPLMGKGRASTFLSPPIDRGANRS